MAETVGTVTPQRNGCTSLHDLLLTSCTVFPSKAWFGAPISRLAYLYGFCPAMKPIQGDAYSRSSHSQV